jgi:tetratricopeptide (TPR) repeat protein
MERRLWFVAGLFVCGLAAAAGYYFFSILPRQQIAGIASECVVAADRQDWRQLERLGNSWRQLDPKDPRAAFWLGESLQCQKKYDAAMNVLEQIPLDAPRGVDAAIRRMNILLHVKSRPSPALALAAELLQIDPAMADPIRTRVYFFAMTLQRAELLQEIRAAIQYQADLPEHYVYLMTLEDLSFRDGVEILQNWTNHDVEAADTYADALLVHQTLRAREKAILETSAETKADLQTLRDEISARLRSGNRSLQLLELALRLALESSEFPVAAELLQTIPDAATDDPLIWVHRGKYSLETSDFEDAEVALRQAIALHPLSWQARGLLATVERHRTNPISAAKLQEMASEGAILRGDCLRLESVRDAKKPLLSRIADFARSCDAVEIAEGIRRRNI